MKIALISLDQKWEDKAANLRRCAELMELAVSHGAQLVIFPEMTLTGFSMNTEHTAENPSESTTLAAFQSLAWQYHVAIVFGLVLRHLDKKSQNVLIGLSSDGQEQARYAKIHPFSFAGENNYFTSGSNLAKMPMPEFKIGFSICYDLRFPELFTSLSKDCQMLVTIANWPQKRVAHWRTLLQSRAIENQCFVIGVNRTGIDGNGLGYEKSSMIINPNGESLKPAFSQNEIDMYDVNRKELEDYRSGFSTLQDRKPDLYKQWI